MSPDGRFVVFTNAGSNLIPGGDTNDVMDVFVRDRTAGTTDRVSVSSNEMQGNGGSHDGAISADGQYVAFHSDASNLVSGDTNGTADVFVRDRTRGTTRRVSVRSNEAQGGGGSVAPSISADGRYVAFSSDATNLVSGDTNGWTDVFVRDRAAATTRRVSVRSDQRQGNGGGVLGVLSADGLRVVFHSFSTNLVSGDTNGRGDVFLRYRPTGTTHRVSVRSNETQGAGESGAATAVSADGRYVAFSSLSDMVALDNNNALDVFLRDRKAGTTQLVSVSSAEEQGNQFSSPSSISADGQRVAFTSYASNLVESDTNDWIDVFVRDRVAGTTSRVSVSSDGTEGNNHSGLTAHELSGGKSAAISGDGSRVAFTSAASNLVLGDTNGFADTFVRDLAP